MRILFKIILFEDFIKLGKWLLKEFIKIHEFQSEIWRKCFYIWDVNSTTKLESNNI
jgi:hypothetical protein